MSGCFCFILALNLTIIHSKGGCLIVFDFITSGLFSGTENKKKKSGGEKKKDIASTGVK